MTSINRTPKPWSVGVEPMFGGSEWMIVHRDGDVGTANTYADALLCAAAPDLADAAAALVAKWDKYLETGVQLSRRDWVALRAALAKAGNQA